MIHYGDLYWLNITFVPQSYAYVDKQIIYNHVDLWFNFNRFYVYSTRTNIYRTFFYNITSHCFLLSVICSIVPVITTDLIKHGIFS